MPRAKPSRLEFTSRRSFMAWARKHLRGELTLTELTPAPLKWSPARQEPLPRPPPQVGHLTIQVRDEDAPAGSRIVVRQYALRVPEPRQWLTPERALGKDYRHSLRRIQGAIWDPVGLHLGGFWFSAKQVIVEERAPIIESREAIWDAEEFSLVLADEAAFPRAAFWLEVVRRAGFRMVAIDSDGFVQKPGDEEPWDDVRLAERVPRNLENPLSCTLYRRHTGELEVACYSHQEEERSKVLEAAIDAAIRKLPEIRVHSGNCVFTVEEWDRLTHRRPAPAPPEVPIERSVVVPIDRGRR